MPVEAGTWWQNVLGVAPSTKPMPAAASDGPSGQDNEPGTGPTDPGDDPQVSGASGPGTRESPEAAAAHDQDAADMGEVEYLEPVAAPVSVHEAPTGEDVSVPAAHGVLTLAVEQMLAELASDRPGDVDDTQVAALTQWLRRRLLA